MTDETLSFKTVTEDIESKEVINLGGFIATPNRHISVNIFKSTVDIYLPYITNIVNVSMEKGLFSDELKISSVSPIFKKKDNLDKGNYRPVSVLPHVSKVFERIMFHQINNFATDKLSKQQDLEKNHCLISMLELWKKILDQVGYICGIFMNLTNSFDTLNHDLFFIKLGGYGFETNVLRYIKSYLMTKNQRKKANKNISK